MIQPSAQVNPLRTAATVVVLVALVAAGGCTSNKQQATTAPNAPKPIVAAPSGTPGPTDSTRLKAGAAPLTYMLGPGRPIRFVDAETGETVARTTAPQQAIISVDEVKGISVANTVIRAGPLPAGRRYELWLDRR